MEPKLAAALETFVSAARHVVELAGADSPAPAVRPKAGAEWSRRLRTAEAAAIMGVSEHALRRRIRSHLQPDGTATFDGVHAEQLGNRYLVRLSRRWFSDPPSGADGE